MSVIRGLKQTECGLLPDDWSVVNLGLLVRSVEYGSSAKSQSTGLVPVLRMGNLQGGKIDWTDLVYTSNTNEISKYLLRRGDVLFNRTNTIDLVGKTSRYDGSEPAIFAGYLIRINVQPELLDSQYLNLMLNTDLARKHSAKVLSVAVGQANINGQKLKTYPIPLPPTLKEQEAIADALSETDAWIESLEQLITKKQQIKLGAMQELLTGKRRLPGFQMKRGCKQSDIGTIPSDWSFVSIGQIARTSSGTTPARREYERYYKNGTVNWVKTLDLTNSYVESTAERVTELAMAETCLQVYPVGTVIVAMYGGFNQIGRTGLLKIPAAVNQALTAIQCPKGVLFPDYLLQILNYQVEHWRSVASSSRKDPNITSNEVREFKVPLPFFAEQVAISDALSTLELEVRELEEVLQKARQIKEAMMQELLTGRIRLVNLGTPAVRIQEAVHA